MKQGKLEVKRKKEKKEVIKARRDQKSQNKGENFNIGVGLKVNKKEYAWREKFQTSHLYTFRSPQKNSWLSV